MMILIILVVIVAVVVVIYNGLVKLRNNVKNAWSQIDVQLQRRFDLIPNLVETVKGYMEHEQGVLTQIAELRTSWAKASTISEKADLDNQLSGALKTIMSVAESYPDLKASSNFAELQEELRNTENKIAFSRQFYNDAVTMYNTKLETIPSNIIAGIFNFSKEELFKVMDENAKNNVKVDFSK